MSREAQLIKKITKKGDKSAANELISLYYHQIYTYLYRQTSDEQLSLDLTQDVFIGALQSLPTFDERKAGFKTWLYKIATNRIVDYYRSKYYRYERITEPVTEGLLITNDNFARQLVQTEQVKEVLALLNTFPADEQRIVRMKLFANHTFREIGNALDFPESTVKTKYYSMLKRLRHRWKESEQE